MNPLYHEHFPNSPGIYCITCTVTEKIYVGSAVNLRQRRKSHFGDLQRNIHRNSKLQRAWNKYGPDAFTFEVLELVLLPELLTAREQFWFDKLQPFGDKGYNLDRVAGSSLGREVSQASREKSRATQLGRSSPNRGRKMTPAQLERHSLVRMGKKQSEEHRRKAAATRIGKKRSPETKEKMREASTRRMTTLIMTSPDGVEYTVTGIGRFCREHGLHSSALRRVAQGKRNHHHGWIARFPD